MIYFVQPVDGGPVKIGFSGDLDSRLRSLQTHYGQRLAVLATLPGGREEEAELHARFSHLRFGKTEQFQPAADLMAFIGRPLLVDANPDLVEAIGSRTVDIRIRMDKELYGRIQRAANEDCNSVATFVRSAVTKRLRRREREDAE